MWRRVRTDPPPESPPPSNGLDALIGRVACSDTVAFEQLYDEVAGTVYGLVRRVLRDPAQSEEVTQEVLVEVWRTAARFDPERGGAVAWIMTLAHGRAGGAGGSRSRPG